jgi:hypothetical protein
MPSPPVPSASNASSKPVGRILLSNDDGFDAMGIQILAGIARQLSDDIWIAAPMDNKSGASRAISPAPGYNGYDAWPAAIRCWRHAQ